MMAVSCLDYQREPSEETVNQPSSSFCTFCTQFLQAAITRNQHTHHKHICPGKTSSLSANPISREVAARHCAVYIQINKNTVHPTYVRDVCGVVRQRLKVIITYSHSRKKKIFQYPELYDGCNTCLKPDSG